ncbi:hypothetical protein ACTXT7_005010 [Hymenolepis weldensis]
MASMRSQGGICLRCHQPIRIAVEFNHPTMFYAVYEYLPARMKNQPVYEELWILSRSLTAHELLSSSYIIVVPYISPYLRSNIFIPLPFHF